MNFSLIKEEKNEKFNSKDNIVLLTFDAGYYMQAINLMLSVKKFNKAVSFICICPELSVNIKKEILNDVLDIGVCVYEYKANFSLNSKRWKDVTCFRVFAPWLIKDDSISEVLYLDADMLCKGSLDPVFNIKNYFLVMCNEVAGNAYKDNNLTGIYCNAGLAKINLKDFRREYDYKTISELFFSNLDNLPYLDQDFLNFYIDENKIKKINGFIYNFQPYELLGSWYYNNAIKNCRIIHFSSFRPWDRTCSIKEYYDLYLEYSIYEPLIKIVKNERKRFKQLRFLKLIKRKI